MYDPVADMATKLCDVDYTSISRGHISIYHCIFGMAIYISSTVKYDGPSPT